MKTQQLDFALETWPDGSVLLTLAGLFFREQIPSLRDKYRALVEEGCRLLLIDLEQVVFRHPEILALFLELLNDMSGRGGRLVLLARSADKLAYFDAYRHLFEIHPSREAFRRAGFLAGLRRTGITYSRKTGIRLSTGMAFFVLFLVAGWVLTLLQIVRTQSAEIQQQQKSLSQLKMDQGVLTRQLSEMETKLAPLTQMGLVADSLKGAEFRFVSDWIEFLEEKERSQTEDSLVQAAQPAPAQRKGPTSAKPAPSAKPGGKAIGSPRGTSSNGTERKWLGTGQPAPPAGTP